MTFALNEAQRELVVVESSHVAHAVKDPVVLEPYRRLQEEAYGGRLSDDSVAALGAVLGAGLGSGRIRAVHGAHGEMEATKLFARTPQGKALADQFDAVNQMLKALSGNEIEKITITARGPGMYTLTIETDEARVVTALTGSGVDVRSVEVAV